MSNLPNSFGGDHEPTQPSFQTGAPHHERPKLRGVRAFAAQAEGPDGKVQQLLGLADARQLSEKAVFFLPAVQVVLPLMDGERTVDQIVAEVGRGLTREAMETIVAQLDDAVLLEGPRFDALTAKLRKDFDSLDVLPPASTAAFVDALVGQSLGREPTEAEVEAEGPKRMGELFDQWIAKVLENVAEPSVDTLPKAIVTPHLDYPRGWINYAAAYGRLRVCERPDRVVVLGTNHFGTSTGVCGCEKGFETILGVCKVDQPLVDALRASIGEALFENGLDHEHEHSIELQIPWIQHVFGKDAAGEYPTVFGALIHDPTVNNGESYDQRGVGLQQFVEGLKRAIAQLPGRTLVVSSADLSHVGPSFGDQHPLAGEGEEATGARNRVLQHDQEMVQLILDRKPAELVASMAWQQNPTRWCSIGNLVATLLTVEPEEVELLNFSGALDPQGMTMVTSVSMLMQ